MTVLGRMEIMLEYFIETECIGTGNLTQSCIIIFRLTVQRKLNRTSILELPKPFQVDANVNSQWHSSDPGFFTVGTNQMRSPTGV